MMAKKVFFSGVLFLLMLFAGNLAAASNESLEKRIEKLEERERSKYKKGESEILVYFKNGFMEKPKRSSTLL